MLSSGESFNIVLSLKGCKNILLLRNKDTSLTEPCISDTKLSFKIKTAVCIVFYAQRKMIKPKMHEINFKSTVKMCFAFKQELITAAIKDY